MLWCDHVGCGVVTFDAAALVCPGCGIVGYPIRQARLDEVVLSGGVAVGEVLRTVAMARAGS